MSSATYVFILRPFFVFLFTDTPTTEIYTLSLHDALPIVVPLHALHDPQVGRGCGEVSGGVEQQGTSGGVRSNGKLKRLRQRGNFSSLAQSAAPGNVKHHELRNTGSQHLVEAHQSGNSHA